MHLSSTDTETVTLSTYKYITENWKLTARRVWARVVGIFRLLPPDFSGRFPSQEVIIRIHVFHCARCPCDFLCQKSSFICRVAIDRSPGKLGRPVRSHRST